MSKKFDGVETLQPLLGKCSVARSVQLLKGAATALDIIHSSGKAHLDLNASTVLVSPGDKISLTDPTEVRAKPGSVIDLWNEMDATEKTAAAFAPEEITSSPSPPDRFRGNDMDDCLAREQKRDLWAFGVLAYWLLYGKQPFVENVNPEDREAFFSAIASNELRFPPLSAMGEAVPLLLRSKIHRCLQKDARLRSNTIGSGKPEVGAEKQSVSSSASLTEPPMSTPQLIKPRTPGPAVVMLDIEPDHSISSSSNKTTPTPKHSVLSFSTVFSSGSRKSTQMSQDSDPRRTSSSTNFISGLGEMQISQQASSDYCTSVAGATNSSSNRLLSDLGEKQVSEWEPGTDEGRRSPRMSPTPGLFEVLLRQHQPGSAATINQISSVTADSRTQSQVARPGALEPQQSEDIVVGPAGFELKCTSCTGDIGPLAFRCETDPRYVICANCRADERYDSRLKLIQYAVEKMDEERITGAFGSEVFQQQSRESTSSSRCASSRIGGGVSPRARTLDNIFGAKAESVLFTEGNDGTPQQVSITGLCSFTTIVESFDLESSCASTAQSVSSRRGPPVVESSLSSAPNISMSPPPNSRREDKPFSPRRGGHMGGGGGLHRSPMWRPVALLPDHPGLADDESRLSPFKPVPTQAGALNPTSQVLVKVEALSQHESTLFGVTGKLPQTQLAATKKNFLQHMGARGGPEAGLEPGRTTTYHEDLVTRVATAKSELDSDSESDASSDVGCFIQTNKPGALPNPRALGFSPPEEDPEEIVDEFLSKADAYRSALAAVEMTVGSSASVIPLQLNLYTLNLERLPQRLESCGKLDTLSVLDLSENRLEVLPDFVGSCAVNLKKLCLGNNKLKFLPETLGGLSMLEVLEVNHNQLSDLPVSLGQVNTLKTIGLDYNNFSSIPECVWCMPQLTTLFLAANPDILEWPAIENLSFVENLTLGIDNHPKLVRSYKEQSMEAQLGDSFEVAWNKVYPEEVLPGKLYLGSLKSAQLEHVYQRLEIGAVLTVARDLKPAIGRNMRHKTIVVDDLPGASFQESFHDCFDFIDSCPQENNPERGPAVLVHCFAGMSRSSTCVIAYLMTKHKMRLDEAYTTTKEARACIYPNDGFFDQLLQLDAKLYPNSEGYRRLELEGLGRGVIPGFEPKK